MTTSPKYFFALPWLNLKENIKIGDVEIIHESRIDDEKIKEALSSKKIHFITRNNDPIESFTLCSYKGSFHFDKNDNVDVIIQTINILSYMIIGRVNARSIVDNNKNNPPPSYELFSMIMIPESGNYGFSYPELYIGGASESNLTFMYEPRMNNLQPFYGLPYNRALLDPFNEILFKQHNDRSAELILRSIEWFCNSHSESTLLNPFSKLLMKMIAFEILLEFPDRGKRNSFRNNVDDLFNRLSLGNVIKVIRESRVIDENGKKKNLNRSLASWFAWDFYKMRNKITHGDKISAEYLNKNRAGWNDLIIADLLFYWLIIEKLIECIKNSNEKTKEAEFKEALLKDSLRREVIEAFSKIKWLEEKKVLKSSGGWVDPKSF